MELSLSSNSTINVNLLSPTMAPTAMNLSVHCWNPPALNSHWRLLPAPLGKKEENHPEYGRIPRGPERKYMLNRLFGSILCGLGFHDFHVIRESFSFGGGGIETVLTS